MRNGKVTPKQALIKWADDKQITPPSFSREMGYTYQHAYQLLRGQADVTFELLGRMAVVYGADTIAPIVSAMRETVSAAS